MIQHCFLLQKKKKNLISSSDTAAPVQPAPGPVLSTSTSPSHDAIKKTFTIDETTSDIKKPPRQRTLANTLALLKKRNGSPLQDKGLKKLRQQLPSNQYKLFAASEADDNEDYSLASSDMNGLEVRLHKARKNKELTEEKLVAETRKKKGKITIRGTNNPPSSKQADTIRYETQAGPTDIMGKSDALNPPGKTTSSKTTSFEKGEQVMGIASRGMSEIIPNIPHKKVSTSTQNIE